jgi:hypothetical protein
MYIPVCNHPIKLELKTINDISGISRTTNAVKSWCDPLVITSNPLPRSAAATGIRNH